MSLSTLNLIDQDSYQRLLAHASRQKDFAYLGSLGTGQGRGSYAGFSALAERSVLRYAEGSETVDTNALVDDMESAIGYLPAHEPASDGYLKGGWIGFVSYEFGYETEPRLHRLRSSLTAPLVSAGLYLWMASYNRASDHYYLWIHESCADETKTLIQRWLEEPTQETDSDWSMVSPFTPMQSEDDFKISVEKVRDYIYAGDCYQANLSQAFKGTYAGDPWQAFKALSDAHPTPYSAFIRSPGCSVLSISPERFLKIKEGQVSTSPIKGTRKRGATADEDSILSKELENSEKDRAENLMIVDLLRHDLSKNAVAGSVVVDKLFALESYRNVHHLVSHIRCKLANGVSPLKALFDAFPGGSITGAPKIRAMEIIRELEPHQRGPYCGTVFHRGMDGSLESNIAIRTLVCDDANQIHCCGGGGIVADSEPDSEYQETLTKVKPLMDFLEELNLKS